MKLAMIRIIAHHTSGEAKPLIPVHDHALSRSAVSVAPRFKRSSDTSTHTTLSASCSQGLPKPEGRTCICFFSLPASHRNPFWLVEEYRFQSSSAFGNRRKNRLWRVGPRYLIIRRKIGFKRVFVCMTYKSSGTSSQRRCSLGP